MRGSGNAGGWRIVGWTSITLSIVLVAASLAAYGFYRKLNGNIERDDVDDRLGADRPAKLNNSLNILLIGSDSRAGENARYGSEPGQRADTTMVLHISPGGERAIGISFPRDSMVQIPPCRKKDGGTVPGGLAMINSAFTNAGAACTWRTIEAVTGVHIDHYVQVDFAGFKRVVDALGGVEICVPKPINDPKAELHLPAGRQTVRGDQALGYVRTRTGGLGDGSDLSRIRRQQAFMASVVAKATSGAMLKDPARVYRFLSAATRSITTDDRLTTGVMRKLADSLKDMSAGKVRFVTVPVRPYPQDPNRVEFNPPLSGPLFDSVRRDNTLPQPAPPPRGGGPPVPPAQVQVAVYNTTGIAGLAQRVADQLQAQGFKVAKVGSRPMPAGFRTRIAYGPGGKPQATALAARLPGVKTAPYEAGRPALVYLLVGTDGARLKGGQAPALPKIPGEIRADQNLCAAAR